MIAAAARVAFSGSMEGNLDVKSADERYFSADDGFSDIVPDASIDIIIGRNWNG